MEKLKNDRLISALFKKPVDRPPIWLMRQAGRYLPEYRKIRALSNNFMSLCKNPALAVEAALQPLERYRLDAAIMFSDILVVPDAMGMDLDFIEGQGPVFANPIREATDVNKLKKIDPSTDLKYVLDNIRQLKNSLAGDLPIIGFSGSPWTLAAYMIEGRSSNNFNLVKKMAYCSPKLLHQILDRLSDAIVDYLHAQVIAGVDVLKIFDTWGGLLTDKFFNEFSQQYLKKIINKLHSIDITKNIPIILFVKNGGRCLKEIVDTNCHAVALDYTANLQQAKNTIGYKVALQGNLDPMLLHAPLETIEAEVLDILNKMAHSPGFIFNLGHGILPDVKPENVACLVDTVANFKIKSSSSQKNSISY